MVDTLGGCPNSDFYHWDAAGEAMMSGADKDYKLGQKNHWRRTAWNAITGRLTVPARDALVLYLAGAQDLDRSEALRRGFKQGNLIAIERNKDAIKQLRNDGLLVVAAEALEVLENWMPSRDVHVLHLDFCCGLDMVIVDRLLVALHNPAFRNAVLCINLMR